jgi:hypothetical protein
MSKDQILFSVWTPMVVVVHLLHLVDLSSNTANITSSLPMQGTTSFLRTLWSVHSHHATTLLLSA